VAAERTEAVNATKRRESSFFMTRVGRTDEMRRETK
jgi:hypothetical protein